MSEQTTPRTVEEAAREEAARRWPITDYEREFVAFGVRFAQQAARMPSVEEVAEVLAAHNPLWSAGGQAECSCGLLISRRAMPLHQAEQVVALWGEDR